MTLSIIPYEIIEHFYVSTDAAVSGKVTIIHMTGIITSFSFIHLICSDFANFLIALTAQCRRPSDFGTCRDDTKVMWFYNTTTRGCQRFWYGGCGGNDNRFKSEKECLTTCTGEIRRGT